MWVLGRSLNRRVFGADSRLTRLAPNTSFTCCAALASTFAICQIGPARAQDVSPIQTTAAPVAPARLDQAGSAVRLPLLTILSRRKRANSVKQKLANTPAPPGQALLNGGPPVTQTTAGPVSGYRALTSASATKTDTPIERIPQAIAVVPRAVLDDQQPLSQADALRNISAVSPMSANTFIGYAYKVRGFPADRYVDGMPNYYDGGDNTSLVNTERIEVLKGPAGILYQGGIGPIGGIINTVSKLPTSNRFVEAGITAGGYQLWNQWIDANQPLTANGTALFRMTGEFERSHDFVDVIEHRRYALNPTFLFNDLNGTRLTIQGSFSSRSFQNYTGLPGAGTVDRSLFTIPPKLFPDRPDLGRSWTTYNGVTVRLDHEFNSTWSANATARVSEMRLDQFGHFLATDTPLFGSTFPFLNFHLPVDTHEFASNANLMAKFATGPVNNTVLFGVDSDHVRDKIRTDISFGGLVDFANPVFPAYTSPITSAFNSVNTYVNSGLTAQWQSDIYEHPCGSARGLGGLPTSTSTAPTPSRAATSSPTPLWKLLPRLGAVVDLAKGVSVFADYTQGLSRRAVLQRRRRAETRGGRADRGGICSRCCRQPSPARVRVVRQQAAQCHEPVAWQPVRRNAGRRAARGRVRRGPHLAATARPLDPCELRACARGRGSGPVVCARHCARARAARLRPALGEL